MYLSHIFNPFSSDRAPRREKESGATAGDGCFTGMGWKRMDPEVRHPKPATATSAERSPGSAAQKQAGEEDGPASAGGVGVDNFGPLAAAQQAEYGGQAAGIQVNDLSKELKVNRRALRIPPPWNLFFLPEIEF